MKLFIVQCEDCGRSLKIVTVGYPEEVAAAAIVLLAMGRPVPKSEWVITPACFRPSPRVEIQKARCPRCSAGPPIVVNE